MRVLALVALVACGGSNVSPTVDAHGDSPSSPDAAMEGPVTITTANAGTPVAGVTVYFQNADSSMVATMMTDATGTASTTMAAGGFVTAIDPYGPSPGDDVLATFSGVKPGDHLVLSLPEPDAPITFDVILPPDPDPSVAHYMIYSSCGRNDFLNGATTGSITLHACHGTADLVVVAADAKFQTVDFFSAPATAVADGAALDLSQHAYVAGVSRAYTYTATPVEAEGLDVEDMLISSHGQVVDQGIVVPLSSQPPVTFTQTLPTLAGASDLVKSSQAPMAFQNTRNIIQWGPYASTYSLDFEANLVADVADYPRIDVPNHAVTWTELAGHETGDYVVVLLDVIRPSEGREWNWMVAAAHSTAPALPILPTTINDFNAASTDSKSVDHLLLVKVPGGYDAVRAQALSFSFPTDLVIGATGILSYSEVRPPVTGG